jgi:hypothetical protein
VLLPLPPRPALPAGAQALRVPAKPALRRPALLRPWWSALRAAA